jgi:hypothetical protein
LDRVYWMTIVPEQSQKLEYFHRQKRRKALIRELVNGSNEEDDI